MVMALVLAIAKVDTSQSSVLSKWLKSVVLRLALCGYGLGIGNNTG